MSRDFALLQLRRSNLSCLARDAKSRDWQRSVSCLNGNTTFWHARIGPWPRQMAFWVANSRFTPPGTLSAPGDQSYSIQDACTSAVCLEWMRQDIRFNGRSQVPILY